MDERNDADDAQGVSEAPSGRHGRPGLAALMVVGVALAGFGAIALAQATARQPLCACVGTGMPPAPTQPTANWQVYHDMAAPPSTANWQVYHDPLGLFIVRLPPGWKASASLGTYSEGGPNGSDSGQTEDITFSDSARGAASPRLYVFAQQSHDAALNCTPRSHETSSFNGYPADISMQAVLMFESENAHFQLDETIPGVLAPINPGGPMNPPPTPTPPSAATVAAERALLTAILSSFLPTARPLACG